MKKRFEKAAAFWGVPFPDDLQEFAAFAKKHPKALEALDLVPTGPLQFLLGGELDESRYYDDPPEFVTTLGGLIDGLHWGYWFDSPGEREPIVASFYANDAFEVSDEGPTLFDAVRKHLDALVRDARDNVTSDPEYADDYRQRLEAYAKVRKVLPPRKKRSSRKIVAATRHKLGVVAPAKAYRPLEKKDSFERWNYVPTKAQVKKFVAAATLPGTALKLGHDLWIYREFREESAALLDRAYQELGREVLRGQLKKAIAWRATCDSKRG